MSFKRTGCGDRSKHWCVTGFPTRYSLPAHTTHGLQVCWKCSIFVKVTQELCLSHGGGRAGEAVYKHSVTSASMETDSPGKHSHAGHDCANCESSGTRSALKWHTEELGDKRQTQRWLLLCPSDQMQPLILPWVPRFDLEEVGRRSCHLLQGRGKALINPINISRLCQPISTTPRTHSNKQAQSPCSKRCSGLP